MSDSEAGKIRYIFSINTGRSGSHYLNEVLSHIEGCEVHHEPEPRGYGREMRKYNRGDTEPMAAIAAEKVAKIREVTDAGKIYVETNHCFIKGFGWFLPDHLPADQIGVIELTRDREKIISSSRRIRSSPLAKYGFRWFLTPDATVTELEPPTRFGLPARLVYYVMVVLAAPWLRGNRFWEKLGRGDRTTPAVIGRYEDEALGWYIDETWARAKTFRAAHPEIRFITTDVDELNTPEGVQRLLDAFDLTALPSIDDVIGRPTNQKETFGPASN